jgi:hypothetical protein
VSCPRTYWCPHSWRQQPQEKRERAGLHSPDILLDETGLELGEALCVNITLIELNLSKNALGEGAAREIPGALSRNTTLTMINLAHNALREGAAREIAEQRHKPLWHLVVRLVGTELK